MKKVFNYLVVLIMFSSCSLFDTERQLEGEVFIVTRGGDNIPLGLTDIAVIENDYFPEALDEAFELFQSQLEIYEQRIEKCYDRLKELNKLEEDHWQKVVAEGKTKTVNSFVRERDYSKYNNEWMREQMIESDIRSAQRTLDYVNEFIGFNKTRREWLFDQKPAAGEPSVFNIYTGLLTSFDGFVESMQAIREQENECKRQVANIDKYLRGEDLIAYITKKHSSAKTNSQGVFSLVIDNRKDYKLVAGRARQVGNENELYFWIIPIEKGKDDISQLFLSNDNYIEMEDVYKFRQN